MGLLRFGFQVGLGFVSGLSRFGLELSGRSGVVYGWFRFDFVWVDLGLVEGWLMVLWVWIRVGLDLVSIGLVLVYGVFGFA